MKHFYVLPTALLATTPPPDGSWHSIPTPGTPSFSVVVVEHWFSHPAQDTWEALPGITELHVEMLGLTAPPTVVTAFAPWGATTGMTLRQVFQLVRQKWSPWRH